MAAFDPKKLTQLDWGVAGAGALALIALFLPWYGFTSAFGSASVSGWSTSYGWFGALLIVAAGVYMVLHRSQVNLSGLPAGPGVIVLGAASIGTLIVALRWLTLPRGSSGLSTVAYSYGPRLGIVITLVAGIVQVVCAVSLFRSSGEMLPWAKQVPPSGGGVPPTGYSPPPASYTQPSDSSVPTSFIPSQADPAPPTEYIPSQGEPTPPAEPTPTPPPAG
jgi:hypothetical protein